LGVSRAATTRRTRVRFFGIESIRDSQIDSIPRNLTPVYIVSIGVETTKVPDQMLQIVRRERLGEQRFIGDIGIERGSGVAR
jgi:hypothetical protein